MKDTYYLLFLAFAVSLVFTAAAMPWLLRFCQKRGLFDMPNERKVHHNKIPRLGGVLFTPAILLAFSACIIAVLVEGNSEITPHLSTFLLFGAFFMIFIIGLIDDLLGLDAKVKFVIQFVASLFMPLCNLYINNLYGFCGIYEVPVWVGYPLTILISLVIINAFNLIDGIDGLSAGLGIVCVGTFTLIFTHIGMYVFSIYTMALLGTLIAYLYYNLFGRVERGTKTFMGDTGSLILGYSIAYLCIKYAMFNPDAFPVQRCPILLSFTLVAVPVFDLIRVAVTRLAKGKGMFTPDKTHIHHLFLAQGMSMHCALGCILLLQIVINVANILLFRYADTDPTLLVGLDIVIYALVAFGLQHKAKNV